MDKQQSNYKLEYKYLGDTRFKYSNELASLDVYMYMLLTQSHMHITDINLQVLENLNYRNVDTRIVRRWRRLKELMPQLVA